MRHPVLELAVQLINIESITGNESAMADFLETYLGERGWQVTRQTVEAGRDNLFACQEENAAFFGGLANPPHRIPGFSLS